MVKKALARAKRRLSPDPIDPTQFNDPCALKTQWQATRKRNGAGWLATHAARTISSNRLEFRITRSFKLLCLLTPVLMLALALGVCFYKKTGTDMTILITVITFGPAFLVAMPILWFGSTPNVFDKRSGLYWKGRKSPREVVDRQSMTACVELKDVHAIQLVSQFIISSQNSGYDHELNLVLHNGVRHNVVHHSNRKQMRQDAETLANFLEVPVWDAIVDDD